MENLSLENDIKSFVFFDLETTGLPDLDYNSIKITELSIVACCVEHFLQTDKNELPRVLHKLTLCFNPFKRISIKSTEITGLDNHMLEHERTFDEDSVKLVQLFLKKLGDGKICLIAHNGKKFDLPLLKKAFEKRSSKLNEDYLFCDSLEIFQKLHELHNERLANYRMKEFEKLDSKLEFSLGLSNLEDTDQNLQSFLESELGQLEEEEKSEFKVPSTSNSKKEEDTGEMKEFSNFGAAMRERQVLNETTPKRLQSEQTSNCEPPRKTVNVTEKSLVSSQKPII